MHDPVLSFYDSLAESYHLLFEDWDRSIQRQAKVLNAILAARFGDRSLRILDCACGIGTQALGLASAGHQVVASDLSPAAIARGRREAASRNLKISFAIADMTRLDELQPHGFDVVAAMDNALPHLSAPQLSQALRSMLEKLKPGGLLLASMRDYDRLIVERPTTQAPAFFGEGDTRRIVHQVWDWLDDTHYQVHLHLTMRANNAWTCRHFASEYRCLQRAELNDALEAAGFHDTRWLMPEESGFYQPIAVSRKG